jgi:hypothetical protein
MTWFFFLFTVGILLNENASFFQNFLLIESNVLEHHVYLEYSMLYDRFLEDNIRKKNGESDFGKYTFSFWYSNLPTCFGDIPRLCNAKVCSRLFGKSIKIHPRREQSVSFKRSSYN